MIQDFLLLLASMIVGGVVALVVALAYTWLIDRWRGRG